MKILVDMNLSPMWVQFLVSNGSSTREQWQEFQRATNPLGLWLEMETVSTGSAMVAQDELHAAYARACTKANQPIVTKQMFGRTLKRLRPELREAQRKIGGRKRWVYLGIGMKNSSGEMPREREGGLSPGHVHANHTI